MVAVASARRAGTPGRNADTGDAVTARHIASASVGLEKAVGTYQVAGHPDGEKTALVGPPTVGRLSAIAGKKRGQRDAVVTARPLLDAENTVRPRRVGARGRCPRDTSAPEVGILGGVGVRTCEMAPNAGRAMAAWPGEAADLRLRQPAVAQCVARRRPPPLADEAAPRPSGAAVAAYSAKGAPGCAGRRGPCVRRRPVLARAGDGRVYGGYGPKLTS